jgi:hypothetical protein
MLILLALALSATNAQFGGGGFGGGGGDDSWMQQMMGGGGGADMSGGMDSHSSSGFGSEPTKKPTKAPTDAAFDMSSMMGGGGGGGGGGMGGGASAVDCVMTAYGSWSACTSTCGQGLRKRSRTILVKASNGGTACGGTEHDQPCNHGPCPTHCEMSDWSAWHNCRKSCGVGETTFRERVVIIGSKHGGHICPKEIKQTKSCNVPANCPLDCTMTSWSGWHTCSKTCGGGKKYRTRYPIQDAKHGGKKCGAQRQELNCNSAKCPVDCQLSKWSGYSKCSRSCKCLYCHANVGTTTRTRTVVSKAAIGGKSCGALTDERECNTQMCPHDCTTTAWQNWGACDKSCGAGVKVRNRVVLNKASNGGKKCPSLQETKICVVGNCAVDCKVTPWTPWSKCSVTCDNTGVGGNRVRTRKVLVEAIHGGKGCPHTEDRHFKCGIQPCPGDCVVGPWGEYGACSKTCGNGVQQRSRIIVQAATLGGGSCPKLQEEKICKTGTACPEGFDMSSMMGMGGGGADPTHEPTKAPTKKPTNTIEAQFDPMAAMGMAAEKTKSPTKAPTEKKKEAFDPMAMMGMAAEKTKEPTKAPTEKAFNPNDLMGAMADPTPKPTIFRVLPTRAPTPKPTASPTPKPTASPTPKPTKAPTEKKEEAFDPMAMMGMAAEKTKSPTKAPTQAPTPKPTTRSKVFDPNAVGDVPDFDFDELAAMTGTDMQEGLDHTRSTQNTPKPTAAPTNAPTASKVANDGIPDLDALMKMSGGNIGKDAGKFNDFDNHKQEAKEMGTKKTEKDVKKKEESKEKDDFKSIADMLQVCELFNSALCSSVCVCAVVVQCTFTAVQSRHPHIVGVRCNLHTRTHAPHAPTHRLAMTKRTTRKRPFQNSRCVPNKHELN